ncbi:hypothetical protein Tco_0668221, partial [Tanacetum coccineum]
VKSSNDSPGPTLVVLWNRDTAESVRFCRNMLQVVGTLQVLITPLNEHTWESGSPTPGGPLPRMLGYEVRHDIGYPERVNRESNQKSNSSFWVCDSGYVTLRSTMGKMVCLGIAYGVCGGVKGGRYEGRRLSRKAAICNASTQKVGGRNKLTRNKRMLNFFPEMPEELVPRRRTNRKQSMRNNRRLGDWV